MSELVPLEAEQALLGAWMSDRDAWDLTADLYVPGMFGGPMHTVIAENVVRLLAAGKPADPVLVAAGIPQLEDEDPPLVYVLGLARAVGSTAAARMYAERVREAWALRQSRRILAEGLNSEDMTASQLIRFVQREIGEVEVGDGGQIRSAADAAMDFARELEEERQRKPGTEIRSTGFPLIDQVTGGMEPGLPHLMAARPGGGKSAYATAIARYCAGVLKEPVGVFWLEDPERKFMLRVAASEANVPGTMLRHGTRLGANPDAWDRTMAALNRASTWPLYIEATKGLSPRDLAARMRRMNREKGVKRFVCDHLSRMALGAEEGDKKATQLLGDAFRIFAETLEALDASGVMFHQLGREAEKGGTPSGAWLFNSDIVFQHARVVGYLTPEPPCTMRVHFAKVTYGPPHTEFQLGWEPLTMTVFNPVPPETK